MIPALALHALADGRLVLTAGEWTATYPALRSATVEKERPASDLFEQLRSGENVDVPS